MPALLKLNVVTPEGVVFQADVQAVTLPVCEGEIQILPGHLPVMTRLVLGQVEVVAADGRGEALAVGEGFARITADSVALLTDMALTAADVDELEVEQARRAAEARLQEKLSAKEHAAVAATLAQAALKLRVKRHHHAPR